MSTTSWPTRSAIASALKPSSMQAPLCSALRGICYISPVSSKPSRYRQSANDGTAKAYYSVYPVVPPKVEYSLTEAGRELLPILDALNSWANKYTQAPE
nr:winged helix-turn-helix transcriptional regulator [Paratractidigestivibacter sp.]